MNDKIKLAGKCEPEQAAKVGGIVCDGYVEVPLSYMQKLAELPDYMLIVSELMRPGIQLFTTKVEHCLFPPSRPELNGLFQLGVYEWDVCAGMPFSIIGVPKFAEEWVVTLAQECGLVLVRAHPALLGVDAAGKLQQQDFPITGPNVYRVENTPNHAVYANALTTEGGFLGYQARVDNLIAEDREKAIAFLASVGVDTAGLKDVKDTGGVGV